MPLNERTRQLNHDLLGPLFYRFCYKLYLSQRCQPQESTHLLFLSRGGVRLRAFYEAFLERNKLAHAVPYSDYYVSRMALIKANLRWSYDLVKEDFLAEYACFTVDAAMKAFLQPRQYQQWRRQESNINPQATLSPATLDSVIQGTSASAGYLRAVLEQEHRDYTQYLNETVGDRKNLLLVDTGWSGSILKYMRNLDGQRSYTALFFGRYNYTKLDPPWFNQVVGLEVQHSGFDRRFPETAIFLNRHLIEGACEIRWPSATGYRAGADQRVATHQGAAPESRILPNDTEPHAEGILRYLRAAPGGMNYEIIEREANRAAKRLCRKLMYPARTDLPMLSVPARSADFGKDLDVPFFSDPVKPFYRLRDKVRACKNSLWPTGQMAIEFGGLRLLAQFLYHQARTVRGVLRRAGMI